MQLSKDRGTQVEPWGGIQPRYSGLRVQGTASSPSSTASNSMLEPYSGGVNQHAYVVPLETRW